MTRKYSIALFALVCLLLSKHADAQKKGFYVGYIVTTQGDTIYGWTSDRSEGTFPKLYKKIQFQEEGKRKIRKFGPSDISAYACGGAIFESLPLREETIFFVFRYLVDYNDDPVFLKVIERHDKLVWYHWEYLDGESNYIDYVPLFHKPGTGEMVRITQGVFGLRRKALADYFRGCPELSKAIENKSISRAQEVWDIYTRDCQR